MSDLRALFFRVRALFAGARLDRELADELDAHLQAHIDDNLHAGMSPDQAKQRALIALGGLQPTRERVRAQRGIPFLDHCARDCRYAIRGFRRDRALRPSSY